MELDQTQTVNVPVNAPRWLDNGHTVIQDGEAMPTIVALYLTNRALLAESERNTAALTRIAEAIEAKCV